LRSVAPPLSVASAGRTLQDGYARLPLEARRSLAAKEVHLCVPSLDDVAAFAQAGFHFDGDLPPFPPKAAPKAAPVGEPADELPQEHEDLFEALEDSEMETGGGEGLRDSVAKGFQAADAGMAIGREAERPDEEDESGEGFAALDDQEGGSAAGRGAVEGARGGFKAEDAGMAVKQASVLAAASPRADAGEDGGGGNDVVGKLPPRSKARPAPPASARVGRASARQSMEEILALGAGAAGAEEAARRAELELDAMRTSIATKAADRRARIAAMEAESVRSIEDDENEEDEDEEVTGDEEPATAKTEESGALGSSTPVKGLAEEHALAEDSDEVSDGDVDDEEDLAYQEDAAALTEDDGSEVRAFPRRKKKKKKKITTLSRCCCSFFIFCLAVMPF
jgi:hypothetical protein